MKWTDEQYTAIYARGKRLLVSAAAGSGKTAVLVERVLSRITREKDPDSLDRLVILTFTNAAASEMRTRIADAIGERLGADPSNRALRSQLNLVQTARIMTVHAFCARLVRENFHVLGITPDFRIISGEEEESLKREILGEFLEKEYAAAEEGSPFWELAENSSGARDDMSFGDLILSIAATLRNHSDPEAMALRFGQMAEVSPDADAAETPWGKIFMGHVKEELALAAELYNTCESIVVKCAIGGKSGQTIFEEGEMLRNLAAVNASWDEVRRALFEDVKFGLFRPSRDVPEDEKEKIKSIRDTARDIIKKLKESVLCVPNRDVISDINKNAPFVRELLRLASEFSALWQTRKREAGMLGFDDLEHCALDILAVKENGELIPSQQALEYGAKISEIMVDEYQDTNGLQDDIFRCLAAGGAELFVVGDVKQSIYRFRNSEPEIFLRRRHRGVRADAIPFDAGETRLVHEDNTVVMQKNFRSLPGVTESVNGVFRVLMTREFGEMDYLPEDELCACREESGADSVTEFNIITPAVCGGEENEEEDGGQSASVREREAAWIARRVAKMVADGEKIYDRALGGCRPVTYGDFAVLVRSAKRRVSVIADAFSELGIPVNTDAGGDIFSTAEVNAVMSMLSAVDNPGRDLALAGYLRSPLECFSADDLGRVKMAGGGAGFYAAMKLCAEGTDETSEKCRNALARLEKMRLAASELDVGRAVGLLLDMSGAFVVFGAMDGGVTRRANLNLLIGLASAYGERGGQDLGGFVKSLERSRDQGDEFPAPKAGTDGVRVMTVHASKGLEFPVVFLANTMEKLNTGWKRENVLVHSDCGLGMMYSEPGGFTRRTTLPREAAAVRISAQQIAEELRLLYVAMTRAREKLIVTGYCENLSRVRAEVESDGSRSWIGGVCRRKASFGRWLLAAVCADGKIPVDFNIYGDESAETAVPSENPDVRQEADAALVEEISRRVNFVYPYINAAGMPAKMTATGYNGLVELAGESLKSQREIALPEFMDKRGDLSAAERGVAVHLAMQLLPGRKYATEDDADAEIGKLVSRGVLSSRQWTVISGRSVKAFYDSAIGGRVLDEGNTSVRREFKFSLLCPAERFAGADVAGEQLLLQGVIDLFWVSGEGYAEIADYKTDNIRPGDEGVRAEGYRSQLEVYRYALEEILGIPVKKAYIWFFKTEKAVEIRF